MAKIKTVTISRAAKVNLGNYENTDVSISITAELDDFEDRGVVVQEMTEECTSYIRTEVKRLEKLSEREEGWKRY